MCHPLIAERVLFGYMNFRAFVLAYFSLHLRVCNCAGVPESGWSRYLQLGHDVLLLLRWLPVASGRSIWTCCARRHTSPLRTLWSLAYTLSWPTASILQERRPPKMPIGGKQALRTVDVRSFSLFGWLCTCILLLTCGHPRSASGNPCLLMIRTEWQCALNTWSNRSRPLSLCSWVDIYCQWAYIYFSTLSFTSCQSSVSQVCPSLSV